MIAWLQVFLRPQGQNQLPAQFPILNLLCYPCPCLASAGQSCFVGSKRDLGFVWPTLGVFVRPLG